MTESRPKQHRPGPASAVPAPGGAAPDSPDRAEQDRIDEAGEETFPASDPPSFTPTDTSGSDSENRSRRERQEAARRRDPEAEAVEDDLREERERREEGSPPPLPRDVEGQATAPELRDAVDRDTPRDEATADQLRDAIDDGLAGDKVPAYDPAAAPIGADEEAAGTPLQGDQLSDAMSRETSRGAVHGTAPRGQQAAARPRIGLWQNIRRLFGG